MRINYKIRFYSDWHCGSGLAAGADVDMLVIKNSDKLPYLPGKTIKGLIREAVLTLQETPEKDILRTFGTPNSADTPARLKASAEAFFTDAELPEEEQKAITATRSQQFLFRKISSTAIDENGVAKHQSLRKIEVVIPCILQGYIQNVPETAVDKVIHAMKFIKRLGTGRNRGLGRCQFIDIEKKGDDK